MEPITVPQALRDTSETPYLIEGPFTLIHNGEKFVGTWLEFQGDGHSVYDGARPWFLDGTYKVTTTDDRIALFSDQWNSRFTIRPLEQRDVLWASPDEDMPVEDLKEIKLDAYRHDLDDV